LKRALMVSGALLLSACSDDPVNIGSKDFAENQILAEMFALLIEEAGLPVDRQIPLGDTATIFEALRAGDIDLYPEYTGTGLALLGLPASVDGDASRAAVAAEVERLGITVLGPLGFGTTYAVVVEAGLADELGLDEVEDLTAISGDLRLAVPGEFATRPEVGLRAFLDRYGLDFERVEVVPEERRRAVYDRLIDDRADVAIGFGTDPEIASYGLTVLAADDDFFPDYSAIPVVSSDALARHPEIASALGLLEGRISLEQMRSWDRSAIVEGWQPREVARAALAEMELLEPGPGRVQSSFLLAIDPADVGDEMANVVLRAARQSVKGRSVEFLGVGDPVGAVLDGRARVALVPAIAQFEITDGEGILNPRVETIAAVGTYYVHALSLADGPPTLGEADQIAAGPVGSPTHQLAEAIAAQSDPPKEIVELGSGAAEVAVEALRSGEVDAAILLAPLGDTDVVQALEGAAGVDLVPAVDWWSGAVRAGLPFLRIATIPESAYDRDQVETLAMQATVIGPAPTASVLGDQGPSTFSDEPRPVTDQAVLAFNENLGPHADVARYLRPSAALAPQVGRVERALNRTPGFTVLSLGIVAFLAWAGWLFTRPPEKGRLR
jgi:osmoprotectant transport system permease protein